MKPCLPILVIILSVFFSLGSAWGEPLLQKGHNVKVLPVGDSITLGKDGNLGGYRRPLYEWLTANGYAITYVGKQNLIRHKEYPNLCRDGSTLYHEGYGSFRTDMILNGGKAENETSPPLAETLARFKPDVVLLMLGTNDIIQNHELENLDARMQSILDTIYAENPNMIVVLAGVAPIQKAGWEDKDARVLSYNSSLEEKARNETSRGRHVFYADIYPVLKDKGLSGDKVHPSTLGYARMASVFYRTLTGEDSPPIDPKNPLLLPPPTTQEPSSKKENP